jgi:hypothetical protein
MPIRMALQIPNFTYPDTPTEQLALRPPRPRGSTPYW